MSRKLVAYFSASGVTANVAKTLAKATDADLYEIKPEIPYTNADLNWMDKNSRSSVEMKDKAYRPAIADKNARIEEYDIITPRISKKAKLSRASENIVSSIWAVALWLRHALRQSAMKL